MLLASEVERLVCTFGREIAGLVFRRACMRARKGGSGGRMVSTRKRIGERSLQVYGDDRKLFAIQRDLQVGQLGSGVDAGSVEGLWWVAIFDVKFGDGCRR